MYFDLWLQYIKMRKLFKGGNYSRAETICGNTVFINKSFLLQQLFKGVNYSREETNVCFEEKVTKHSSAVY